MYVQKRIPKKLKYNALNALHINLNELCIPVMDNDNKKSAKLQFLLKIN